MWCYAILAPAVIFVLTGVDRSYQTDLWHHLARGREICATGRILSHDVFTYTVAGQGFVDNNWLTQVVAWQLYRFGGIELLQAANSLLLAATVAILVGLGMRLGASPRVAAGVGVAMVVGLSQTLLIRPQTVSMLLFAALLLVLITRRALWTAPLILMLWANVHGAFPIGLVLISCFVIARRVKWWWVGLAAVATLANPYGWRVYLYVLNTSSRATDRVIQEWLKPDLFTFYGGFWLATIVCVTALMIWRRDALSSSLGILEEGRGAGLQRRQQLSRSDLLPNHRERGSIHWSVIVVLVFALISCTSIRMSIWWYLAAAPIVMALWPHRDREPVEPSPLAAGFYAAILVAMTICLPAMQRINPVFTLRTAERTEDSLQQLAAAIPEDARMFTRLEWGEYFSFALPWKHNVFMDGRIEIYGDQVWDEYRRISSAEPDWQELLDRYKVNVLVLDRHYHDGLLDRMQGHPQWREIASAGTGAVFVRGVVDSSTTSPLGR
jgi:hypothetical protein